MGDEKSSSEGESGLTQGISKLYGYMAKSSTDIRPPGRYGGPSQGDRKDAPYMDKMSQGIAKQYTAKPPGPPSVAPVTTTHTEPAPKPGETPAPGNGELDASGWAEATKADKEIGGANLKGSLSAARGVIDEFGTDGLKHLIGNSAIGNNPEVVRLLARVSKALGDRGKGDR